MGMAVKQNQGVEISVSRYWGDTGVCVCGGAGLLSSSPQLPTPPRKITTLLRYVEPIDLLHFLCFFCSIKLANLLPFLLGTNS